MNIRLKFLLGLTSFCLLTSFNTKPNVECEVVEFYKATDAAKGTITLNQSEKIENSKLILEPIKMKEGFYSVEISFKTNDLYKIENYNIYIKTKMCLELSAGTKITLKVDGPLSFTKGKIIF